MTDIGKLERANRQLRKDNEELRNLCCFLDDKRQKNRKTAVEWQSFGKYTAAVLKNEVETFECKLQVLQEQLEKVVQENSELQEMCLYLDQSREQQPEPGREAARLASPEPAKVTVHSFCAPELNKKEGIIPQFTGSTSQDTLKDSQKQRNGRKPAMQCEFVLSNYNGRILMAIFLCHQLQTQQLQLVSCRNEWKGWKQRNWNL